MFFFLYFNLCILFKPKFRFLVSYGTKSTLAIDKKKKKKKSNLEHTEETEKDIWDNLFLIRINNILNYKKEIKRNKVSFY